MNEEREQNERKKWFAAVMGMTMPGMGQVYNGELIKGLSAFIIFLALFTLGFRWTTLLPDRLLIVGAVATIAAALAVYVVAVVEAYGKAKQTDNGHRPKGYNHWYFYLALWLLGSVLVSGGVYDYVKNNVIEAYKIVTPSMEPAVLRGDHILADKTAFKRIAPKKGDIVLLVYPDDRSKVLIRRIAGLPGDAITMENGAREQVPHGMIYVLGSNAGRSIDSREFGFVPQKDLIGKARQIYYSSGENGVRWNRIGRTLGEAAL